MSLSNANAENRGKIKKAGGLQAVAAALEKHQDNEYVVSVLYEALVAIAKPLDN